MILIDRSGTRARPICRECHKPGRAHRTPKPNWICAKCFNRSVQHILRAVRRNGGYLPVNFPPVPADIRSAVSAILHQETTAILRVQRERLA